MVISMNQPTEQEVSGKSGAPLDAEWGRRPLYARSVHRVSRIAHGLMLLFYLFGVVTLVITFTPHPIDWRDTAGVFLVILVPWVLVTNLRAWTIYGSIQGLEIARWGVRRTIQWSKVGEAEYAWWSLNYASRMARLTLHDEETDRTILFFANDRLVAELHRMRELYSRP
jgi:hypothetical protein